MLLRPVRPRRHHLRRLRERGRARPATLRDDARAIAASLDALLGVRRATKPSRRPPEFSILGGMIAVALPARAKTGWHCPTSLVRIVHADRRSARLRCGGRSASQRDSRLRGGASPPPGRPATGQSSSLAVAVEGVSSQLATSERSC
jgi:hypothetical protein